MGDEVVFLKPDSLPLNAVVKDLYEQQLHELWEVRNASLDSNEPDLSRLKEEFPAVQVYYPWRNMVVRCLPEAAFYELKTSRNQLLITKDEQQLLNNLHIAIAGMSVGSSIVFGLVGTGIARKLTIADFDTYSTSNLNRVQTDLLSIGENKAMATKRRALEMNPFLQVHVIDSAINEDNVSDFLGKTVDAVFEEIDDFKMKFILRERARQLRKPFIMLTNLGDNVQIDLELYDREDSLEPFFGRVSAEEADAIKTAAITPAVMKDLSVRLVQRELIPDRAIESLKEIGASLRGRPQLYSTVALDGGIAPYLVRKLFIDKDVHSGSYALRLSAVLSDSEAGVSA